MPRLALALLAVLVGLAAAPAAPGFAAAGPPPGTAATRPGVERLRFRLGPIPVRPGQNDNVLVPNDRKPRVDGWIVGFRANLVRRDGSVPPVDELHLHHGVWIVNGRPVFATGEEKTAVYTPDGFGLRHRTTDTWFMEHMIHDLMPAADEVFITYDIDFIPDGSPAAAGMREARTQWLDVMGGILYQVFDVH